MGTGEFVFSIVVLLAISVFVVLLWLLGKWSFLLFKRILDKPRVPRRTAVAAVVATVLLAALSLTFWTFSRKIVQEVGREVNRRVSVGEGLNELESSSEPTPSTGDLDLDPSPPPDVNPTLPPPAPPPPPPQGPVPPRPVGSQRAGYFACQIFFATNRAVRREPLTRFASERGDGELIYGSVEVSIPGIHEPGRIESPEWWRFWATDDAAEYVLVLSTDVFGSRQMFEAEVEAVLAEAGRDDVLLFVHGYNVEFEEAAKRTAQLTYDLRFPGVPMFFSWPSRGEVDAYPADEASVEWSVPHFQKLLRFVLTEVGARRVHIIAHSMGNRALVRALSTFDRDELPPGSAELRQIVLAAPDIDAGVFKQLAASFPGKAERITLYTSRQDKAILASMSFHRYPRAGGSIVVVPGVDTIDASVVQTDFLSHSYYGDSIISDIAKIIRRELSPEQRGHRMRPISNGVYWEYLHLGDRGGWH